VAINCGGEHGERVAPRLRIAHGDARGRAAPLHRGRRGVDKLPLDVLIGPARLIAFRDDVMVVGKPSCGGTISPG